MTKNIILGAGPAGLSAAYLLNERGNSSLIIERAKRVGGLSKTYDFKGFKFDIGPHVFKNRNKRITKLWENSLDKNFLEIKPISKLYYKDEFVSSLYGAVKKSNPLVFLKMMIGLILARLNPKKRIVSAEDWAINAYGKEMYNLVYRPHEENFWGEKLSKIDKKWAMVYVKKKPLVRLLKNRFFSEKQLKKQDILNYPEFGSGTVYENFEKRIKKNKKNKIILDSRVVSIKHNSSKITSLEIIKNGKRRKIQGDNFISTIPINKVVKMMDPKPPKELLVLSNKLYFRDLVLVNLVVNLKKSFPCDWSEISSKKLGVGRVTNFKKLSKKMGDATSKSPICMEYYCLKDGGFWKKTNKEIIEIAKNDLFDMGLIERKDFVEGFVVKLEEAYPVYILDFEKVVDKLKDYLDSFKNFQSIGRNGAYTYNNMGHSVESGLLAAENILGKRNDISKLSVTDDEKSHSGGNI